MAHAVDQWLMVAVEVPDRLWRKPHPGNPKDWCCFGFEENYDRWDSQGLLLCHLDNPVGRLGILYDGCNLEHCLFGVVLRRTDVRFGKRGPRSLPNFDVTAFELLQAEDLVLWHFKRFLGTAPDDDFLPGLVLVNHEH